MFFFLLSSGVFWFVYAARSVVVQPQINQKKKPSGQRISAEKSLDAMIAAMRKKDLPAALNVYKGFNGLDNIKAVIQNSSKAKLKALLLATVEELKFYFDQMAAGKNQIISSTTDVAVVGASESK